MSERENDNGEEEAGISQRRRRRGQGRQLMTECTNHDDGDDHGMREGGRGGLFCIKTKYKDQANRLIAKSHDEETSTLEIGEKMIITGIVLAG